jgi:hypothetical protein
MHEQHLAREDRTALARYDREINRAQAAAQKAFASLNGWIVGKSMADAEQLVPRDRRDPTKFERYYRRYLMTWQRYVGGVSDHDFLCREPVRPYQVSAVVCQPYNDHLPEAHAAAERLGLALHVPADPTASIWNPGSTQFLVFTRPGVTVNWLPEQKTATAIQTDRRAYADPGARHAAAA